VTIPKPVNLPRVVHMTNIAFSQELATSFYNSNEAYPIDLDDAWVWLGYNQKSDCLSKLKSNFKEGQDFLVSRLKTAGAGRPRACVMLTIDCFEKLKILKKELANEEKQLQSLLHKKRGGSIEVSTPAGRIDLLTSRFIIEIKTVKSWKSGLGQLLVYQDYYPSHGLILVLFGACHSSFKKMVEHHCSKFNIKVEWLSS